LRPPKVGRGGAYLLFESNLAQFRGWWLHIHLSKGVNSISLKFENARKADQGQDVGDFYGRIGV
jgi:hypothetical protein